VTTVSICTLLGWFVGILDSSFEQNRRIVSYRIHQAQFEDLNLYICSLQEAAAAAEENGNNTTVEAMPGCRKE
jgi:hypothetical protein